MEPPSDKSIESPDDVTFSRVDDEPLSHPPLVYPLTPTNGSTEPQGNPADTGSEVDKDIITDSPMIGVWGLKSSGKTTFLGMLIYHIQRMANSPLRVEFKGEAKTYVTQIISAMETKSIFVEPTNLTDLNFLDYYLVYNRKRSLFGKQDPIRTTLRFMDCSGEYFDPDLPGYKNNPRIRGMIERYLRSCTGMIVLIEPNFRVRVDSADPTNETARNAITVTQLINMLEQLQRDRDTLKFTQPLAVCLTKIDRDQAFWSLRNNPEKIADTFIPDQIRNFLINNSEADKLKWFAVSNVGCVPEGGNWVSNTETLSLSEGDPNSGDTPSVRIKYPHILDPWGLDRPVTWLLERLTQKRG